MPHIEHPSLFERLLLGLDELDEEARQENPEQPDAEQDARTAPRDVLRIIEPAKDAEGDQVAKRLVNLGRVYRRGGELVHPLGRADEFEAPRQGRGHAEDLRIEQVAQPDDGTADAHRDHDAVERPDIGQLVLAREQPEADQEADGSAVAGHAAVPETRDDRPRLAEVFHRVVEEAVPQPRPDDRRQRTIYKNRLGDLRRKPLTLAEVIEKLGADQDCQRPHQSVIADVERPDGEEHRVEIPNDA